MEPVALAWEAVMSPAAAALSSSGLKLLGGLAALAVGLHVLHRNVRKRRRRRGGARGGKDEPADAASPASPPAAASPASPPAAASPASPPPAAAGSNHHHVNPFLEHREEAAAAAAAAAARASPFSRDDDDDDDANALPVEPAAAAADFSWAGVEAQQGNMQRSATMVSAVSERRLSRVSEEESAAAAPAAPLALRLEVVAGPCGRTSFTTPDGACEVTIGRAPDCALPLDDAEVSGRHAAAAWNPAARCWQVADLGSLNGTLLNGQPISAPGRARGQEYRLSTDDILQLGSHTQLKVATFPRELLGAGAAAAVAPLPAGSLPGSLRLPKHRVPSFTSLASPKINSSPGRGAAAAAAASEQLRLECCIAARTGRDHARKGQPCEDVACAECPLAGSEAALSGGHAALFCVFDGHCGRGAAEAAAAALPAEVSARLRGARAALRAGAGAPGLLRDAFLAADARIAAEQGCTATAVLAWEAPLPGGDAAGDAVCLQAANAGDSSALFVDPATGAWRELTEDHRLSNPAERARLEAMGIPLAADSRRLYGLNLSRGLGDKFLKDEGLGLSAEPHVGDVVRVPEGAGGLLLVASDGLWDVAGFQAVADVARAADAEHGGSAVEVAGAVVAHALKQRTRDDVTVLVVRVWSAAEWEARSPSAGGGARGGGGGGGASGGGGGWPAAF